MNHIDGDNRRLFARGGGGLRIWRRTGVAETEDICVFVVNQRRLINVDPSSLVRQRARPDEIRRGLRRTDMHHVEVDIDTRGLAVNSSLERCAFCASIDRDEIFVETKIDAVFLHIFHQRGHIGRDPEQNAAGIVKLDVDIFQDAAFQPRVTGKVHRFLRRAGAFDRHGRLRKQRLAFVESFDKRPGVRREII